MSRLPRLTESQILEWTGGRAFERGKAYFRQGAVYNPRRQASTLKAQCTGSQVEPYHVEVELGADGVADGHCSCPVGAGGQCKHAAALLLTWLDSPEAFLEAEDMQTLLQQRSKEELIRLIRRMIARHPALESLLELAAPAGGAAGRAIDPELIRRQVLSAFRSAGDDWGAAWDIARKLDGVVKIGQDYAQSQDWRNAMVVYRTVAQELLDNYETVHEEEGELIEVVGECVEGLRECLAAMEDAAEREAILRALFDIYRWDVDYGGIGAGDDVPAIILDAATPEEKQQVARWVQEALPAAGGSRSGDYHRKVYGGFLLKLRREELDEESFLTICRETGRLLDLVERLLELHRVEEAAAEARAAGDYDLLRLAEVFEAAGHGDLAESLIRERLPSSTDRRLVEWLKQWALKRGDLVEALELADRLFRSQPSLRGYEELKSLAGQLDRWGALRPQLSDFLTQGNRYGLLTEIHLLEGEIDAALETVSQPSIRPGAWGEAPLHLRVARAAEAHRPYAAITLYTEAATRLIQARGRPNYLQAAVHLGRVRDLYRRLGEEEQWNTLIAGLREQNRRLSALKEELNRAGL